MAEFIRHAFSSGSRIAWSVDGASFLNMDDSDLKSTRTTPSECPVCGADVPPRARACPACGADERTGWNEEATRYDGLDLPDHAFRDDDSEEKSSKRQMPQRRVNGVPVFWWLLAVLLLAMLIAAVLGFG
jgi:hypothetical protein